MKTATQNILGDTFKLEEMLQELTGLKEQNDKSKEREHVLSKRCNEQEEYIQSLIHDINVLRKMIFGPKTDKYIPPLPANQLTFADIPDSGFSDDDEEQAPPSNEEEFEEISYSRKKKTGRKKLPNNLPRIDIEHDLTEEEKTCVCGKPRPLMDVEVTERLHFKPVELTVERHKYPIYGQCNCENPEKDELSGVISTPREPRIMPKSIATPSLLSYIFTSKFVDGMPFYRLNKQFERYGIPLSRQNMSNWAIKVMPHLERLLPLLKAHVHSSQIINMDETPFQVLSEPGRKATTKSYMWLMYGGPPGKKAVLYNYSPSRSGAVARELLGDYSGCVQTDAYSAYLYLNKNGDILHITCMAHIRRKFVDLQTSLSKSSFKKNKKSRNNVDKILRLIRRLYSFERQFTDKKLTESSLVEARQSKSKAIFEKLKKLVGDLFVEVPPQSIFGKALSYAEKNLPLIEQYLNHHFVGLDNNSVENEVRPFAIGRKNWLFSGNVAGAKASAAIHSLVQTAKLNNLNSYKYLSYIFQKLPEVETEQELEQLLPFNLTEKDLEN